MARARAAAAASVAAVIMILGAPIPVAPAPVGQERARIPEMEHRAKELTDAARNTKGGPQQQLLLRREKLRSLIERLDRGEDVDPSEIDRLLQR